jgi:hypothetical protein
LCGKLGNAHDSAASKCYGAVAFTNNSIEFRGRAPKLASSYLARFYKEITKF